MRSKFDSELDSLNNELIILGAMCEAAIKRTIQALENDDKDLAKSIVEDDKNIDLKERDIESSCLKLVLQQQPVARDLRLISSALKMITDMERIGDQAADIAEIIGFTNLSTHALSPVLIKMAQATSKMVTDSIDAFVKRDIALARQVMQYDDIVDELFVNIRDSVINRISTGQCDGGNMVDIVMMAKYLERIGDHATNIAEWVEFAITGNHPEWE